MSSLRQPKISGSLRTPLRMHFENVSSLGDVFKVTEERARRHLAAHGLGTGIEISIGADGDGFEAAIQRADILFGWRFDREVVARSGRHLSWIHLSGAGIDHLLPLDWLPPNTMLTNSSGIHGRKAGEYAQMALLMLNSRLPELITHQKSAQWKPVFTPSIAGKTVLIIGLGHMGTAAARCAKRMGLYVIGIRRTGRKAAYVDEIAQPENLPGLLPRADFVLVAAPLTPQTRGLIGAKELALLKDHAGIANMGRAGIVDYEALRKELQSGRRSAVLDVFDPEPLPPEDPMWITPNVILTPHCSSDDQDNYIDMSLDIFCRNLARLRARKPLINRVSRIHGY
jgi:glyoxylate/hydroxypyruvate reductase